PERARLDIEDIDAIARQVVDLPARSAPLSRYLDTATVARMLNASEEWVRDHAAELGAIRLGDGCRGVLRFDPARVERALDQRRLGGASAKRSRRRPARPVEGLTLLPLPAAL